MQRSDISAHKGLIFVMNNRGDTWNGAWVGTQWNNKAFVPPAWYGREARTPLEQQTLGDGRGEFSAQPKGDAVYVPRD